MALVDSVVDWTRSEQADRVHLWMTGTNDPARRLYERCGFANTGERQPLPSDTSLVVGMELVLANGISGQGW